jgi:hypothetical protein
MADWRRPDQLDRYVRTPHHHRDSPQSESNQEPRPMTTTPKNHRRVVAIAFAGLALVGTGLTLAVLSNPKRFSIDVADDRYIQLFVISGFACTFAGILLFLYAVRNTTKSMPAHLQTNANLGMALGFVLQLAGSLLPETRLVPFETGLALILAGLPAFVWGGMHYAQGKGHSKSLGLLAILGILGLIVLILLPHRESEPVANDGT